MVGGVTGYNKGTITMSGDKSTEALMKNVTKVSELLANAKAQKLSADSTWVKWADRTDVEKLSYNGGSKSVAADRTMQIIVSSNGNLGGVAGYNAPTGELNRCVSGSWLLVNKSDGIGVGTGGIVGMNESEKDLSYLLNQAFVGRQLKQQNTSRFAAVSSARSPTRPQATGRLRTASIMARFTAICRTIRAALSASGRITAARLRIATITAICRPLMQPTGSVHPAVSWHSCIMRPPVRISIF